MSAELDAIWLYLAASPLLGLLLTLLAYQFACELHRRCGSTPLLNPVAVSCTLIILVLLLADIPYRHYFEGAQFVHFLLGPAIVALAVPLYQQLARLRALLLPLGVVLVLGSLLSAASALITAALLGADEITLKSLAPKSVTTPVAMGITEAVGGEPSLTAFIVVTTGIIGAILGPWVFRRLGIADERIQGIALGLAGHGIGTARAFQIGVQAGSFSGLTMALSALLNGVFLPWLMGLMGLGAPG
ncbi:LrgB family protein [Ferrimonas sediminicola]|uniref:LrgB family protein n=1 Tax=Ferrimonas sediminicola TaxID=2569538 RepID=A0A4U1BHK5_9GAMM|nr:LrgB family protein [Ferrimonas sediminicola]TKB50544.1 LrgB family protein [Ferrimonas sediminicola]